MGRKCIEEKLYTMTWRNKWLTDEARTIEDMIKMLSGAVKELRDMRDAGVKLMDGTGTYDDYAELYTYDQIVAARFGMDEEDDEEEEDDDE